MFNLQSPDDLPVTLGYDPASGNLLTLTAVDTLGDTWILTITYVAGTDNVATISDWVKQ